MLHVQKSNLRRNFLIITLLLIVIGCLAYAGYDLWRQYNVTHGTHLAITDKVISYSTSQPSETNPIEACNEYTTEDGLPERISISAIGVTACIVQVGIDQHNTIAAPDNIYVAGWYMRSTPPGRPGLSVMNGHPSGQYKTDAIFRYLNELKAGDSLTITLGSGKVLTYEVYKTQSLPLEKAAQIVLDKDPGVTSQLNLMTSGETRDKTSKQYEQRSIVSAALR